MWKIRKILKAIGKILQGKIEYETPYISDLHKEFLKTTLFDRKELLLEKAISQNTNMPKLTHKPKGPRR